MCLRVSQGGHNIPTNDIIRKYKRGLDNLFNLYWNVIDNVFVYNATTPPLEIIFAKNKKESIITNKDIWNNIRKNYGK